MKKPLLIALTLIWAAAATARPVDPEAARKMAQALLDNEVVAVPSKHLSECFLFAATDGNGFVLLSADDCARPLLAYSHQGRFPTENMPPNLQEWLIGYQREIASIKALDIPQSDEVAQEWELLKQGTPKRRNPQAPVWPLLKSYWNQEIPYNSACPYDSAANARALTGCTATATAQVMRFWQHPAQGRGSHSYISENYGPLSVNFEESTYDWENAALSLSLLSSPEQIAAVAKLCYDVGVSMDMSYSTTGSGAYAHSGGMLSRNSAELALENYFGYNPAMYNACKNGYSEQEWDDLISSELNAGRPLIYTGSSSSGGHAFVVDGYSAAGLYHVNWGWGGAGNGYFTLSNLAMGVEGQPGYTPYNEMNEALIGVYPITPNESTSVVAVVSADPTKGSVSGSGTYPVGSDRVLLLASAADGYRFSHWASGNRANPIFYYPTVDYADTAYFVPLSYDTVGYCMDFVPNFDTLYSRASCEWGIRIPPQHLLPGRQLEQVRNFIYTSGNYTLRIYQGERPETPLYEDVLYLQSHGWRSITLNAPIPIDPSLPLWITFASHNVIYSMGISPFTGVNDGSWVVRDGQWQLVDTTVTGFYTWSIQGILGASTGIASPFDDGLQCSLDGLSLKVLNSAARPLALYDLMGRPIAQPSCAQVADFRLPAPGVYLLKADGCPARRIIASR